MSGPFHQPRFAEFLELRAARAFGIRLPGIGRDDFQIVPLTEREQGIVRAAAGMNAAEHRRHAHMLFDESDSGIQIARAEQQMIQFFRHCIACLAACQHRGHQRTRSHAEK